VYLTAWLIGDEAVKHMRALTAPKDRPPAEKWLPLCSERESGDDLDGYRSAFAFRVGPRGQQWVDFAVPPAVVAAALGQHALAPRKSLAMGSAPATALRQDGGQWLVGVPRFFTTFTTGWTYELVGRNPLITRRGEETGRVAAGDLAIEESFRRFFDEPALIVGSAGPRLQSPRSGGYVNVGGLTRTDDLMAEIAALAPDTQITCIWCEF
jgi:hypothetical protein